VKDDAKRLVRVIGFACDLTPGPFPSWEGDKKKLEEWFRPISPRPFRYGKGEQATMVRDQTFGFFRVVQPLACDPLRTGFASFENHRLKPVPPNAATR
jgi:hypothetical protein